MPEILIQSKITTPQLHEKIVHRERLTSLLNENKNKNLIIICAPAGFGKTTLVLDYLSTQKNKHGWFSIPQKGIEDAPTFFEYIIGAVQNLNNDFGDSTAEVMKQFTQNPKMSKELVYGCTASFVNEFQKCFSDDIVLVIEDLHFIESEKAQKWLAEFFEELLNNIPSNLHLILSTRIIPEMYLTQLKARRNVLMIDENELTFNEEETGALLDEVYKYKYDDTDIKLLDENVKGWITGLHLLLQAYGEDFSKVKYKGKLDTEIIFDFFAHEIFDNLSPELQEFMMVTSLMESFDAELANAVLGIENSKQLTEELIHRNLFIHQVHSIAEDRLEKKISYGYHALFRDFLKRRLESSKLAEGIKNLMEKIGDCYVKTGDEIDAVDYYLEAGSTEKAIPIITKLFFDLFDLGKCEILQKWASCIPDDILNTSAPLLYRLGYLSFHIDPDDARASYLINKALELFDFSTNQRSYINCFAVKVSLLEKQGKMMEAIKESEWLLQHDLNPENRSTVLLSISPAYGTLGNFDKAIELLEEALRISENIGVDELRGRICVSIGYACYRMGNYEKSIHYYKRSLENEKMKHTLILANGNMAQAYDSLGDYSSSMKYLDVAFGLLKNCYLPTTWISCSIQESDLMRDIGEIEESTKILEEIFPLTEKINERTTLFEIAYRLLNNCCLLDDYNKSVEYLNLTKQYSDKLDFEYFKKISFTTEAFFSMNFNIDNSIENKLLAAYDYFKSINAIELKLDSLMYLTVYYLKTGDEQSTLKNLREFLNEFTFKANDLNRFRNLIDFALSRPELAQYKDKVHHAFTEFFDRPNIEGTSDEYKRKMKIEIEKLYDIKMTSFGPLEFISRGVPVPESKWKKKKGKFILAYIMLNPKGKYNKDKIIDMFFPDAKPETVEDNFKQAVFSIRSTFKNPYLNFLILENKMLYLNPDCYFKSDAEEFNKLCNIARSAEHSCEEKIKACKDAIMLYKGEFMEGNYEPWCEDLRGDFHNKFISISELLLVSLVQMKKYEDVIRYSEKLLKHDKLNEKAYLSLVEAFVKTEKPKSARESYSKMLKTYEEELGEDPDQKTLSKIESLLES